MSQAALNPRDRDSHGSRQRYSASGLRCSNGDRLVGLLFLVMVIICILWIGWRILSWMKDASQMPLSELVVTGERHVTKNDDIRQAILSLGAPGTFMTQNVDVIQQQIERLLWIKQASVRKQWPDKLKIHVVEYKPVAHWNDTQLLDDEGKLFSVPNERFVSKNIPQLYGLEGSESSVLAGYRTLNEILTKKKFTLTSVSMSARHSWHLTLNNNIQINLGLNDLTERLSRFAEIYPLLQQQAQATQQHISYVDLRYDSGIAVGWQPVAEGSEARQEGQLHVQ